MRLIDQFQHYNLFRTPDWRFQRVLEISDRETPGRCTPSDDSYVRSCRNFYLKRRHADSHGKRERLFYENPGLYFAYEIYENAPDNPAPAAIIEARLLASQTYQEIADLLGTLPTTIEWYEKLFFNVVDRLHQRDWITTAILIPTIRENFGEDKFILQQNTGKVVRIAAEVSKPFLDASLKFFAFFGGRYLVDLMLTGFEPGKPVKSMEELSGWIDRNWKTSVRRRSVMSIPQVKINAYNVMELFDTHTKIMAIEAATDTEETKTAMEANLKAMLDELPFTSGQVAANIHARQPIGIHDEQLANLRDSELYEIQSGKATGPRLPKLDKMPIKPAKVAALNRTEED